MMDPEDTMDSVTCTVQELQHEFKTTSRGHVKLTVQGHEKTGRERVGFRK